MNSCKVHLCVHVCVCVCVYFHSNLEGASCAKTLNWEGA